MTFKEKLQQEHPEHVGKKYEGGCDGCPVDYNYETNHMRAEQNSWCEMGCAKCWDREAPDDQVLKESIKTEILRKVKDPYEKVQVETLLKQFESLCIKTSKESEETKC